VLIVTGIDYPGHHWRETAPVLAQALRQDDRLDVFTVQDPNFLDSAALQKYDLVVLHFQNWQQPGPGERSRENLRKFVAAGKGLALVHFACGAWHQEWPEFENLAGRVWFGSDPGPGKRQHDPYGPFRVEIVKTEHPIVRGMADFDTQDELYTCLTGDHPIQVLARPVGLEIDVPLQVVGEKTDADRERDQTSGERQVLQFHRREKSAAILEIVAHQRPSFRR
jgi:type 1 glutamine amidotransferase